MARSCTTQAPNNIARSRKGDVGEAVALRWFYNSSPATLGLRSNFGAFVAAIQRGGASGGEPSTMFDLEDEDLEAIGRHRKIREALARCDMRNARILEAAYTYERRDPSFAEELGELSAVAVFIHSDRVVRDAAINGKRSALRALATECKAILESALLEFRDALAAVVADAAARREAALSKGRA